MKKLLFQEVFKKAKTQTGNSTKHGLSVHLERVFVDDLRFSVNRITFVRYYEKYIDDDPDITNNPSADLLNKLSEYIDYENYEDFVSRNNEITSPEEEEITQNEETKSIGETIKIFIRKNKISISIVTTLLLLVFLYGQITKQRYMVWENDHYVEVKFDLEQYDVSELKLYKKDRIERFRKITPDCSTEFFKVDGSENLWYGKNAKKELEYFTDFGLHPETGKTLKKITKHMIKNHICDTYE